LGVESKESVVDLLFCGAVKSVFVQLISKDKELKI